MPEKRPYVLFVVTLLLVAQSTAAQSAAAAAEEPAVLMYRLPAPAINPGPAETDVVLSFEIDGAAVATQTVRVPAEDPPRDRLIEVLAGQSAARADVERRLRGGRNAAVVVRVDGKQYQRLAWKDLLSPTQPDAPPATITTASVTTAQQQCTARCDEEYEQCERTCEPYSGPNACWDCRDKVEPCWNFCATCPRTWRSYGSWVEVLPRQTTGQLLCAYERSANGVRLHREFFRRFTRTVTQFTEHCDHTITRVTTYETMSGENCWTQIGGCAPATDVFGTRKKCP